MLKTIQTNKAATPMIGAILAILTAILIILLYNITPLGNQWREKSSGLVNISSTTSLIHVGSNDSFATTQDGILAGRLVLDYLENKKPESAKKAIQLYDKLIPLENYGGEYTTLQWFCQYLLASETERKELISDKFVASFYDFFAENDFTRLKEFLQRKYKLKDFADKATEEGIARKAVLEDTILFNNPRREEWEKTSKVISYLNIKPGQTIADVGSGPGYYSFKFSQLVGDRGHVFAIDTVKEHLNYINNVRQKYGIRTVETIQTSGDVVFLCSLYHNIYAMSRSDEIDNFVNSIKNALKKDGSLIIVDNALVSGSLLPYHGPYIAKELIIGQFKHYGFHLVKQEAFIPQRYILEFKKD
jgi:protein-L-isoaspartate O-methyltransferase